ncbi:MAG: hypothetical protein M9928_03100 [Anaerolineae bacterium]|nr:hypothetical protein [Anaerolineae bacterium]MCO5199335.1 hypothetical protein [Anaerolineae bacterium]MCO5203993.1 hypothetical protein [Anaerolineae bacterium]
MMWLKEWFSAELRGALQAEKRFNRVLLVAAAVALGLLVLLTVLFAADVVAEYQSRKRPGNSSL